MFKKADAKTCKSAIELNDDFDISDLLHWIMLFTLISTMNKQVVLLLAIMNEHLSTIHENSASPQEFQVYFS